MFYNRSPIGQIIYIIPACTFNDPIFHEEILMRHFGTVLKVAAVVIDTVDPSLNFLFNF